MRRSVIPTYSYQCQSCGQLFELFLSINDNGKPTQEPCPYCGQNRINQVIVSAPPLVDPYVLGAYKVPSDFSGFLKNLKDKNPGSNINV